MLCFVDMRVLRNRVDHAVDNTRVDRMGDVEGKQSDAPLDQFECIRMVSFQSWSLPLSVGWVSQGVVINMISFNEIAFLKIVPGTEKLNILGSERCPAF